MGEIKHHKVVSALPSPLEADSIYYIRRGDGYDICVTNSTGLIVAYSLNQPVKNHAPINLMPDSGRFSTNQHPLAVDLGGDPNPSSFLSAYNGSVLGLAGTFLNNNSTYGGTAGGLSYTVELLLAAMGRSGDALRYGISFYIAEYTAGTGTNNPNVGSDSTTRYRISANPNVAIFTVESTATMVMWLRCVSGSIHIGVPFYLDGVLVPAGTKLPDNSWHHVRVMHKAPIGYDSAFPYVYATVGAKIHMAIPAVFHGPVDIGKHTQPIPFINSSIT